MFDIKKYLLSRADSLTAWIGCIGFTLEVILHGGHSSTVMLVLFVCLLVFPENTFRDIFKKWTREVRELDRNE